MHTVQVALVGHKGKRSAINVAPSEGVPAVTQGGAKGSSFNGRRWGS